MGIDEAAVVNVREPSLHIRPPPELDGRDEEIVVDAIERAAFAEAVIAD